MKVGTAALLPLSILLVVLAVGSTLSPCLGCFYYSEDLVQVWLAWLELTAHPELVTQHFTMPWFQCSNMGLFYRPVVQMSYITDFLLYGRHVAGFHLTNLTCHVTSSVICLLIARHLINKHCNVTDVKDVTGSTDVSDTRNVTLGTTGATVTGLVAALLFGLNPLQCEPVYWLCCRCDGLCTMFSLSSIY